MLKHISVRKAAAGTDRQSTFRPVVEKLEDRLVPVVNLDIQILAATTTTSHVVKFDYTIQGSARPFDVRVYRSADAVLGNADDVALPDPANPALPNTFTISPPAAGTSFTATVALDLPPDAVHPYVFVAADPDRKLAETNETNNTQFFRTFLIGVVTHGFELTPGVPAWATAMANALQKGPGKPGYDVAFAFDWSLLSKLPLPGMTQFAARGLERKVLAAAGRLPLGRNDVIDLHFIGHSRGAGVNAQAIADLANDPAYARSPALRGGWIDLTWLDPHPARNLAPLAAGLADLASGNDDLIEAAWFSHNPASPLSKAALATILVTQEAMNDPLPVVPRIVDRLDVVWQNNPAPALSPVPPTPANVFDALANSWGYSPALIVSLDLNPYSVPLRSTNLTGLVNADFGLISHYEVPLWYLQVVVPTLV